jgi:hypothetical protein
MSPEPVPIVPGQPSPTPPAPSPVPAKKNRKTLVILLAVGVGVAALCCIGGVAAIVASGDDERPSVADPPTQGVSTEPVPASPPSEPALATTLPAPAALPKDATYTGRGAKVIKLTLPEDYVHVATITHRGSSNFIVKSIDSDGSDIDLIVNEIGRYTGTHLLDITDTQGALSAIQVEADGAWSIVVKVLQKAKPFTGSASGKGSDVLLAPAGTIGGLATASVTHKGSSNFIVKTYAEDEGDLLVNEIGNYTGQIILADGTLVIEIIADGTWSINLD